MRAANLKVCHLSASTTWAEELEQKEKENQEGGEAIRMNSLRSFVAKRRQFEKTETSLEAADSDRDTSPEATDPPSSSNHTLPHDHSLPGMTAPFDFPPSIGEHEASLFVSNLKRQRSLTPFSDAVDSGSSQPHRRATKRVKREDITASALKPVTSLLEDLMEKERASREQAAAQMIQSSREAAELSASAARDAASATRQQTEVLSNFLGQFLNKIG